MILKLKWWLWDSGKAEMPNPQNRKNGNSLRLCALVPSLHTSFG